MCQPLMLIHFNSLFSYLRLLLNTFRILLKGNHVAVRASPTTYGLVGFRLD